MKPKPQPQKINKTLGLICSMILAAVSVQAANLWNGGTMSYNTPTNWSGGQVPSASVTGNAVNNSGSNNVVLVSPGDPDWTLGNQDIHMGNANGTSGSYLQTGAHVTLNYWFRMGLGDSTSSGYAELDGGILTIGGRFQVGESGTAVFTMTGGTLTTGDNIGLADGSGTGNGTFNQSGGSATDGNELWVGNNIGSVGTVNLTANANLTVNNWLAIGRNGSTGVINMTNNAVLTKAGGNVITFAGLTGSSANGTLNQSGFSTVNCANNDIWLPEDGTGTWNMSGSCTSIVANIEFGRNPNPGIGTLNLNGGILSVNSLYLGGGSGTLNFNGGTLQARAGNANFMNGVSGLLQAGGAIIDSQGFDITINSVLADGGGGGLTKVSAGMLTLLGANTYVGPTIVGGGALVTTTASTATGAYTVNDGAGFGVTLTSAGAQFAPATVNLGTTNGTTLSFDLGAFGNPTVAPLNVTGNLAVNGNTVINIADGLPQLGQFHLIQYSTKSGSGTFTLGTLPSGVVANLVISAGFVDLNITGIAVDLWDGLAGGNWDINTTTNWLNYATLVPTYFTNGDAVLFDDSAMGTTTVNVTTAVSPASVRFNNNVLNYTLTGAGAINGSAKVSYQGGATNTILTTNGYTGATVVSAGWLVVTNLANGGTASSIGASTASANNLGLNGGTLSYAGPPVAINRGYSLQANYGNNGTAGTNSPTLDLQGNLTLTGPITASGASGFVKSGPGTLTYAEVGTNQLSGGNSPGYQVYAGTVVFDGSAGQQVNHSTGEFWVGDTTNSGANIILTNTTLNVDSWFSLSRGNGDSGWVCNGNFYNSTLRCGNFSLGWWNNRPNLCSQNFTMTNSTIIDAGAFNIA